MSWRKGQNQLVVCYHQKLGWYRWAVLHPPGRDELNVRRLQPENRHKLMNMFVQQPPPPQKKNKNPYLVKKWCTTSKLVQEVLVISSTNEAESNQTENVWRVYDWGERSYRSAVTVLNTTSLVKASKTYTTHAFGISQSVSWPTSMAKYLKKTRRVHR